MTFHDLKDNSAIPLGVAEAKKPSKAPKVPASYGKLLVQLASSELQLTREQLAAKAGVSDVTAWRVETGHPDGSVKAAHAMRQVLVDGGVNVPPVPVGAEDWQPPPPARKRFVDPVEENICRNMIRVREALGMDQFAAAHAIGIPTEELRSYEDGERSPASPVLAKVAKAYGCRTGDFFEAEMPTIDRTKVPGFHLGGELTKYMTAAEREAVEQIFKGIEARKLLEDKRALGEKTAPKKPRPKTR